MSDTNGLSTFYSIPHPYRYCLTLTTFRFPFPPRLGPGPLALPPSVAFMPALIVSINIPAAIAGEYVDNRLLRAGWGSGGTGSLQPGFNLLIAGVVVVCAVCLDFC